MSENLQVETPASDQEPPAKEELKENGQDQEQTQETPSAGEENTAPEETKDEVKNETEDGTDSGGQKKTKGEAEDGNEEEEQGDDEEEEEESSDEELPQGSLDGPVKILEGKRERKKVERLSMEQSKEISPEKKVEFKEGRGTKLGEIPNIEYQISRTHVESLKSLHRILFSRQGKITEIRKNIRKFSGYPFEKEDVDYKKKEAVLQRTTVLNLKEICTMLDLEKSGNRDQLVERILDFCLEPKDSGKPLPVKRKPVKQKKKKKVSAKGDAPKSKKAKPQSKKRAAEDLDGEEEEEEEYSPPKKKKAKKETPKKKAKTPAKSPQKKKSTPAKPKSKELVVGDSSDEDEPLSKKSKSMPSEDEIKDFIKDFLDGANLEEVTMKTVCKKVYDNYPEFDLSHKKDFIKTTVKEIIST